MPRPFGLATSASIALSLMRGCAYTTTPVTTHDGLYENLNLSTPSIASTVAGRKSGSLSKKSPFGGGEPEEVSLPFECNGYEYELRAAARAIAAGLPECPEAPRSATLAAMRAMDALRAAWGVRFPCDG